MGLSGRMPESRHRATVMLRAVSVVLILVALPVYALAQLGAEWNEGDWSTFEIWFVIGGYFVFAAISPLMQLLGYYSGEAVTNEET